MLASISIKKILLAIMHVSLAGLKGTMVWSREKMKHLHGSIQALYGYGIARRKACFRRLSLGFFSIDASRKDLYGYEEDTIPQVQSG